MEIQVEELDYCKIQVSCVYDSDEINKKKKEVLKIFKEAPVPGFRKGKATAKVIQDYYSSQIKDALKKSLAEEALHQSMFEKQFKPLTPPQFKEIFLQPEKFSCQFVIDKQPDFELCNLSELEVPLPPKTSTEQDFVQKVLQNLRLTYGEKNPFGENDFTEIGDVVSVTYQASVDGEHVQELSSNSEGDIFTLGNSTIPNFDQNLLQLKVGESREFEISVDNKASQYFNKNIKFKVDLNMAMKIVPCSLDDSLAKKLGKESFDDLLKEVHAMAFAQIENQYNSIKSNAVLNKLASMHQFKVPEWLVLKEAQYLASSSKLNWETLNEDVKNQLFSQGEKNIRVSLILEKIRESEPEAQMSDQEVFNAVNQHLSKSGNKSENMMRDLNKLGYLQVLYNRVKDEYTMGYLVKNTKYVE